MSLTVSLGKRGRQAAFWRLIFRRFSTHLQQRFPPLNLTLVESFRPQAQNLSPEG